MNYCDFLFNAVERHIDNLAVVDLESKRRYSYLDLKKAVLRMASFFKKNGLMPGQVVATHLYNGIEAVVAHLAVQFCGGITCLLDPLVTSSGLDYYLKDSEAVWLCSHLDIDTIQLQLKEQVQFISAGNILETIDDRTFDGNYDIPYDFAEEELAAIFYTSGTTSKPKGVMLPTRSFYAHVRIFNQSCYQYSPEDNLLCFVPFSHGYGSKSIFLPCLQDGATMVLMRSFHPLRVIEAIEKEQITHIFGVPSHYQQLLRRKEFTHSLKKLKAAFSAAALLKVETAASWHEKMGFFLDEGYGLIETCTGVAFRLNQIPECLGHIGRYPKDLVEIEIVDENFSRVPSTERGELIVRGSCVMLGYLNKPEETASALHDGWFRTGDMGYKTKQNELVLTGRIKDVINVAGIKVAPFEIEAVLNEHPQINESAVLGVEDEMYGEIVTAYVRCDNSGRTRERDLMKYLQNRVMNFQVPKQIIFVDDFPRNNMGKTDKKALREITNLKT